MINGSVLKIDKIILSTGGGTAKFLADCTLKRLELQVDGCMITAAVDIGVAKVSKHNKTRYNGIPVTVYAIESIKSTYKFDGVR